MSDEDFHDILMIWLLRRPDLGAAKDNLEGFRKRYDVYSDIFKTYEEISKSDYISNLIEEERQWREKDTKKKRKL